MSFSPLVMASEVAGLDPLHGYLKHGNLVLRMRFPYLELQPNVEKFVERKVTAAAVTSVAKPETVQVQPQEEVVQVAPPRKPPAQANEQQHFFE
ncbi:MAG: hypothetical protein QOJ42_5310 [Acidobacteriaceae bacterium]|nr:hypothetical protein [Acidobacteriaceae bacterium]